MCDPHLCSVCVGTSVTLSLPCVCGDSGDTRVPPGMLCVVGRYWGQGQSWGYGTHSMLCRPPVVRVPLPPPAVSPCFGLQWQQSQCQCIPQFPPSVPGGHLWPWDLVSPAPRLPEDVPPPAPVPRQWRVPAGGIGILQLCGCSASPHLGDMGVKVTRSGRDLGTISPSPWPQGVTTDTQK